MYNPEFDKRFYFDKRDIPENCTVRDAFKLIESYNDNTNIETCEIVFRRQSDGKYICQHYVSYEKTGERRGEYNIPVYRQKVNTDFWGDGERLLDLPISSLYHRRSKCNDRSYLILIKDSENIEE